MNGAVRNGATPKILVVGAGVVGLTTALCLSDAGYRVVVAADRFAPDITSVVAGALWEWPPAVCGQHRDEDSLARSKEWCMVSYRRFTALAHESHTGVFQRPAAFYFRQPIAEQPAEATKLRELRKHVAGVVHDRALAVRNGVNPAAGIVDAYSYPAPMIDTDRYLDWLLTRVRRAGVQVRRYRFDGELASAEAEIRATFQADAIVNCSGLGSVLLTGEEMYPLRGALVYAHNDGRAIPRLTGAHCMSFDESVDGQNMVFIVPRGEDKLVLGGLVEPDEWRTDLNYDSHPAIRDMLARCQEFLPVLRGVELVSGTPWGRPKVRIGLRPARVRGVRLEWQPGTRIVHNVGHGGSGVTLSWGCAREAVELVGELLAWPSCAVTRSDRR